MNTFSRVQEGLSTAADIVNQAVIRPAGAFGILGFRFPIPQRETVSDNSDITDHVSENKDFVTDNISHRPLKVTLTGSIPDVLIQRRLEILQQAQELASKVTVIGAYGAGLTSGTVQFITQLNSLQLKDLSSWSKLLVSSGNLFAAVGNLIPLESPQARALLYLQTLKQLDLVMTIQTPWAFYTNMVIETINFAQTEVSATYSEGVITFKRVNFQEQQVLASRSSQGRVAQQSQITQKAGPTRGTPTSTPTLLRSLTNTFSKAIN